MNKPFDIFEATELHIRQIAIHIIHHVDETELSIVQTEIPQVLGLKGEGQVGTLTVGRPGYFMTIICSLIAFSKFEPNVMIFKNKYNRNSYDTKLCQCIQ
jgi:hypothetical protein